jgi:hypothetical protein
MAYNVAAADVVVVVVGVSVLLTVLLQVTPPFTIQPLTVTVHGRLTFNPEVERSNTVVPEVTSAVKSKESINVVTPSVTDTVDNVGQLLNPAGITVRPLYEMVKFSLGASVETT